MVHHGTAVVMSLNQPVLKQGTLSTSNHLSSPFHCAIPHSQPSSCWTCAARLLRGSEWTSPETSYEICVSYNSCVLHHLAWSKFTSIRTLAVSFLGRSFHSSTTHCGTFIPLRTFLAVHMRRTRAAAAAINFSWHAWMKRFCTHGLLGAKVYLRKLGKRDAIDVEAPGGYCALQQPSPLLHHVEHPHEPESALVFVPCSPATMKYIYRVWLKIVFSNYTLRWVSWFYISKCGAII